ncbi:hypothetical protein C7999DRAFT_43968 [Corynascus novoguineensis]|uniref:Uncharacterized protein n=1 Tax=Corynascus novoguineensis TaxID=1126955 RepID=A0AAN7HJF8_9PEZI|nr:hypothetical protein C7999DRAFT_43968 [Corynascus novoguineensis]
MATTNSNLSQNDDPPFPASEAHMGGVPTPIPDTPVIIIFLILFAVALGLETLLYRLDCTRAPFNGNGNNDEDDDSHYYHRRRYLSRFLILHPFPLLPALRITFLLTRLAALATRLAWTYHPRAHGASDLEVASTILAPAGSVLLLIANPLLARRFARDYAAFGPHPAVVRTARAAVFCAVVSLVMGVSTHADAYFTREREELDRGRSVRLVAECIRLAVALLPVLAVLVSGWGFPLQEEVERDRPRLQSRGAMICGVGLLLTLQQGFRTGVAFEGSGPQSRAWFLHKATYYCFVYLIDLMIVSWFLAARLDRRFRRRPAELKAKGVQDGPKKALKRLERWRDRVNSEKEVFGDSG